ncbi:NUMOD4 motif-containing HNH endonuclease [Mycobacterium sp. CnD-18-1]|uniref:NUMOD4 motif-containing HNH endonuclease n=1 Tax=Mycobacterium sp. CnD-18-1 TaxID=2917744 RepID=UPI001EF3369B|nr:NUMOD4 motif-containing HNH endonuclease [Mycobacterium sp. CnD-18-1]MCG7607124.1 NUMOD4 motif-containing HNH endonuclease [Mycobacterium sp. CnD-18-1]
MFDETWLPIEGYEGCYEVSDHGRVKSLERLNSIGAPVSERILKPMLAGRPKYCTVALHKDGVRNVRKVHHLVLEAFVGGRPEGMMCLHDNDIPTDNRLENLSWGTGSDNQYDSVRNGRHALAAKTHCSSGHPLAGDNLYVTPDGMRACRECNRKAVRKYRQRKSQAANA